MYPHSFMLTPDKKTGKSRHPLSPSPEFPAGLRRKMNERPLCMRHNIYGKKIYICTMTIY